MADWWQIVLLGLVEGVTEFLPISSTGHLLIAGRLLGFEHSLGGTFEIFIQLGAVLAVLSFYARELMGQVRSVARSPATRAFWLSLGVAFLPAALAGLLLRAWIKAVLFASPSVIAWSLIAGGAVLIAVEHLPRRPPTTTAVTTVSPRQALVIGLAQALALVPGVSRSGAAIVGGLITGLDRPAATAFSFYLAIPTLGAATLLDLLLSLRQVTPDDFGRLALGTVVSFVVAWASMGWLLRYVSRHRFVAFGIYRIIMGVVILVLLGLGRL